MKGKTKEREYGGRSCHASGGKVEEGVKVKDTDSGADYYAGGSSNTAKEAERGTGFKKGGKVGAFGRGKESEGEKLMQMKKQSAKAEGDKAPHRLDRPKRASGGAVSGSRDPFSAARKTSERPDFKGMKSIND